MANLRELIALRDQLKATGSLLTSGGIGAAVAGALAVPALGLFLAPIGLAAGAYGLLKRRSGDELDNSIRVAIQEELGAIFRENPQIENVVHQILPSFIDDLNGKPVARSLSNLATTTGVEINTLEKIVELLLKHSLIIRLSDTENTYIVHELVALFVWEHGKGKP